MSDPVWLVAHTRPRCEKKLVQLCERNGIATALPCYQSVRQYRSKKVVFDKPLFPGYVFAKASPTQSGTIRQSDYTAKILIVHDQELFLRQLSGILQALETGLEIQLVPEIGQGTRVKIKNGPLAGIEGWVEARHGMSTVLLRLDFIGQAAAVKFKATDLELI